MLIIIIIIALRYRCDVVCVYFNTRIKKSSAHMLHTWVRENIGKLLKARPAESVACLDERFHRRLTVKSKVSSNDVRRYFIRTDKARARIQLPPPLYIKTLSTDS